MTVQAIKETAKSTKTGKNPGHMGKTQDRKTMNDPPTEKKFSLEAGKHLTTSRSQTFKATMASQTKEQDDSKIGKLFFLKIITYFNLPMFRS